jgi:hypothetical protein
MNKQQYELRKLVRETADAHPGNFDMEYWVDVPNGDLAPEVITIDDMPCGTTLCVAGWAVLLGDGAVYKHGTFATYYNAKEGRIEKNARDLLGLSWEEADALFNPENSEDDAIAMLDLLIAQYEGGDE